MKRLIVGTLFVGSLLLVLVLGPTAAPVVAKDGRAIFDAEKCGTCHGISSLGVEAKTKSEAMMGGDLSKRTEDPEWIAKYLRRQEKHDGKDHKKEIKISDEDMAILVEWLRSEKS